MEAHNLLRGQDIHRKGKYWAKDRLWGSGAVGMLPAEDLT